MANFPFAPQRAVETWKGEDAEVLEELGSGVSTNCVYELLCLKTEDERLREGVRKLEERGGLRARRRRRRRAGRTQRGAGRGGKSRPKL